MDRQSTPPVTGTGNRQRLVFATNGGKALIADWLAVRGDAPGALLCPVSKSGTVDAGTGITPQALMYRLRKRCDQARIKRASPHDLRRTFVSSALAVGADLARVQRLAGHRNPATTERYDRRPEDALREAAAPGRDRSLARHGGGVARAGRGLEGTSETGPRAGRVEGSA